MKSGIKKEVYDSYHIPGQPNFMRRPKNAVHISPGNGLKHEVLKTWVCYALRKEGVNYITECVRNKKVDGADRRVDIVNLHTGEEIEIEMTERRARRFQDHSNVTVIKGWLSETWDRFEHDFGRALPAPISETEEEEPDEA